MSAGDHKTGYTPEVPATSGDVPAAAAQESPTPAAEQPNLAREPETTMPAGEPEAPVGPAVEGPHDGQARPQELKRDHEAEHERDHEAELERDHEAELERDHEAEHERDHEAELERDHEAELEHDLEELTAKAQKADEYLELAQRTRADFENYRKRAARESAAAQHRGIAKLVKELLPAVDNLDRALAAAEANGDGSGELVSGLKLVHAEVIAALGRAGVERFSPEGEQFDPERHEAVAQQAVEGAEPGTIVDVYQRGYVLGEAVIRPARVLVAG